MIKLQTLFSFEPFHRMVKGSLGRLESTSMIKVVGIPASDKVSSLCHTVETGMLKYQGWKSSLLRVDLFKKKNEFKLRMSCPTCWHGCSRGFAKKPLLVIEAASIQTSGT